LANFFSLVAKQAEIPASWEKAYLFILYKAKGEKTSPDSFCDITLKLHVLKLFETLLQSRLVLTASGFWHLLFECQHFDQERQFFQQTNGHVFEFDMLLKDEANIALAAVEVGCAILSKITQVCQ
jgi:hypothetical protein